VGLALAAVWSVRRRGSASSRSAASGGVAVVVLSMVVGLRSVGGAVSVFGSLRRFPDGFCKDRAEASLWNNFSRLFLVLVGVRSGAGDELVGLPVFPDGALGRWRRLCGIGYSRLLSPSPACALVPASGLCVFSGVSLAFSAFHVPVVASHAWNYKGIATCPSPTEVFR